MSTVNTIYKRKGFNIYSNNKKGYIVHNTKKNFHDGHTHINSFNTATYIIDLCIHKSIPDRKNKYIITSLTRLTNDKRYRFKLLQILDDIELNKNICNI